MTSVEFPALFLSQDHECGYFKERTARTLFVDPEATVEPEMYNQMLKFGFRRSGNLFYRSYCEGCSDCIPVRVPANDFLPNRTQRRCWHKNSDIECIERPARFYDEHFALFQRYIAGRHEDGNMQTDDKDTFLNFFISPHMNTRFYELRLARQLVGVYVTDFFDDAMSAVYTFFDPDFKNRSLGVFSILSQLHEAKSRNLSWLYLGYWIKDCQKMAYKSQYRPLQTFNGKSWNRL